MKGWKKIWSEYNICIELWPLEKKDMICHNAVNAFWWLYHNILLKVLVKDLLMYKWVINKVPYLSMIENEIPLLQIKLGLWGTEKRYFLLF